jgi:hypothetical protein
MKVIITLTTIPPRFEQTSKNIKYMLSNLGTEKQHSCLDNYEYIVMLNLPKKYDKYKPNPEGRNQLKSIHDRRFLINENTPDMGPGTKIFPVLSLIRNHGQNPIVLILDDEKYHPDAISRIIKIQKDDMFSVHSYWVYNYKGIQVPQGVDIIATSGQLLRDFRVSHEHCKYVDDLLLAQYFSMKGIRVKQVPRYWKWPWIPTHPETGGLFGEGNRETLMEKCYNYLKS